MEDCGRRIVVEREVNRFIGTKEPLNKSDGGDPTDTKMQLEVYWKVPK